MRKTSHRCMTLVCAATLCLFKPASLPAESPGPRVPKVGLALSGGGARGAAHIGVLKVLEREQIPIDCIAGTSFGALIGGLYALGYTADQIAQIFANADWGNLFSDAPERRLAPLAERVNSRYMAQLGFRGYLPELPTGLWNGQKVIEILNLLTAESMLAANYDFDRLPIPFRAVATDLLTGKPYVFRQGRMIEALRASVAIPMLFTPLEKGDMLLVDGGLSNNLPADIAREMGADIVIAVDATSPLMGKNEIRSFLDVIDQTISLMMRQSLEANAKLADFTIKPDLEGYVYSDYLKTSEITARGAQEAERRIGALRPLLANIPARPHPSLLRANPVVDSIAFEGLRKVPGSQLKGEIKSQPGDKLDGSMLREDIRRLYATRFFDSVDCNPEYTTGNHCQLKYILKESTFNTVGASIRYDNDYKFVALADVTARQLLNTPSTATLSLQFGGFVNHMASLRYIPTALPFLYVEPKVHLRKRERLDIRNEELVDKYTDKRIGGQLMIGGTFLKRTELEIGYRDDKVTVSGGTLPYRQAGSLRLAGITLRMNRDTLDAQEFPTAGTLVRLQFDRRSEAMGSDVTYSKAAADIERHFSWNDRSTVEIHAALGVSRGPIPFYDRFYIGGLSFSEGGARHLPGYSRDELLANQMAILGSSYRYRFFSRPLSFVRHGFITAEYNIAAISTRQESPFKSRYYNGVGFGLAFDTLLGPMRFAGGVGEGGRSKFYMSLGPSF